MKNRLDCTYISTCRGKSGLSKSTYGKLNKNIFFWASLADRLGGSSGFDRGCETGTSAKDLDPGVAFVVGWEIGTVASLGYGGNLGTGVSFP